MNIKGVAQLLIFMLSWLPIVMIATGVNVTPTFPYSIYNTQWNGLSDLKTELENQGYTVKPIFSTVDIASRYHGDAVLVIIGPVMPFTESATLGLWAHLAEGGGVLIADDFGSTNNSLIPLNALFMGLAAGSGALPSNVKSLISFEAGVLYDIDSYDEYPTHPIITDISSSHPIMNGVHSLELNRGTALKYNSLINMAGIARTTARSWCDRNGDELPNENEIAGHLAVVGVIPRMEPVLNGSIVVTSDPDIFTNDGLTKADNNVFALNAINYLADYNTSKTILFAENLLQWPPYSPEYIFGAILSRATGFSTNAIIAPLFPILAALSVKRWIPEVKPPEVKRMTEIFQTKSETFFTTTLESYKLSKDYAKAIKMLIRKLKRDLMRRKAIDVFNAAEIYTILQDKGSSMSEKQFYSLWERLMRVIENKDKKLEEEEFLDLFFFIKNIEYALFA